MSCAAVPGFKTASLPPFIFAKSLQPLSLSSIALLVAHRIGPPHVKKHPITASLSKTHTTLGRRQGCQSFSKFGFTSWASFGPYLSMTHRSYSPEPHHHSTTNNPQSLSHHKKSHSDKNAVMAVDSKTLMHILEILGVFICAHHLWPKGITYGDPDDWETKHKKKHSSRSKSSKSSNSRSRNGGSSSEEARSSERMRRREREREYDEPRYEPRNSRRASARY